MATTAGSKALTVLAVLAVAVASTAAMEAPAPSPVSAAGAVAPPLVGGTLASVAAFLITSLRH
uniref:Uncharacterized protein n=1 Tax=Arundo donax TaxID=35708 RepID=A0A0A8XTE6_ARUDO